MPPKDDPVVPPTDDEDTDAKPSARNSSPPSPPAPDGDSSMSFGSLARFNAPTAASEEPPSSVLPKGGPAAPSVRSRSKKKGDGSDDSVQTPRCTLTGVDAGPDLEAGDTLDGVGRRVSPLASGNERAWGWANPLPAATGAPLRSPATR